MEGPVAFDWDDAKAASNRAEHTIGFEAAIAVLSDPNCAVIDSIRAEDGGARQKAVGTIQNRLFTVVFVMREPVCRIVSARRSNINEERAHGNRQARPG